MRQCKVHHEQDGNVAVVSFFGEFDYAEMAAVEEELSAVEAHAPDTLLLDLTGLEFMDSSAVRVIVQADNRARAQGRRLALIIGTGPPARVLSILGLMERLDVVADRAAVIQ